MRLARRRVPRTDPESDDGHLELGEDLVKEEPLGVHRKTGERLVTRQEARARLEPADEGIPFVVDGAIDAGQRPAKVFVPIAEARELPIEDGRHGVRLGIEEEIAAAVVAVNERDRLSHRRILLEPIERYLHHRMVVDRIILPNPPPPGDPAVGGLAAPRRGSLERGEACRARRIRESVDAAEVLDEGGGEVSAAARWEEHAEPTRSTRRLGWNRNPTHSLENDRRSPEVLSVGVDADDFRDRYDPSQSALHLALAPEVRRRAEALAERRAQYERSARSTGILEVE